MPELPEIETIRRELKPKIINKKITDCIVLRKEIIGYPEPKIFGKSIVSETITDVTRKAKYLILNLTQNKQLIFHLRLSGAIILSPHSLSLPSFDAENYSGAIDGTKNLIKFARLILKLSECNLIFEEPRALGRVYLLKGNEQPDVLKGYFNLSHEPISPEFDFAYFKNKIAKRKALIKSLLLDQSICAGIGNIYSDEALFRAGIKPLRRAYSLKTSEIFKLLLSLKDVLNQGIENFGTTVSDYKRTDGRNGKFQNFLNVYARENEPCHICGAKITLKKIASRGTRYCPKCQK